LVVNNPAEIRRFTDILGLSDQSIYGPSPGLSDQSIYGPSPGQVSAAWIGFRGVAIASASHLAISAFLANGCVQASEETTDFRQVISTRILSHEIIYTRIVITEVLYIMR
jgi:hypothetical protein